MDTNEKHGVISRTTLHEQVQEEILHKLRTGEWEPGMKLPSEQELVDMFGVSRHAVREALRSLGEISILETKNGQGTFIRSKAPRDFSRHMSSLLLIDKLDMRELYEYRIRLEPMLVTWAIEKLNDESIQELRGLVELGEAAAAAGNAREFAIANVEFHTAIARATGNPISEIFYRTLRELMYDSYTMMSGTTNVLIESAADHRQIFNAMTARDVQEAVRITNNHIRMVVGLL